MRFVFAEMLLVQEMQCCREASMPPLQSQTNLFEYCKQQFVGLLKGIDKHRIESRKMAFYSILKIYR